MDESEDDETLEYEIEVVESSASSYTGAFESDDSEHSSCSPMTNSQQHQDDQLTNDNEELANNQQLVNNLSVTTLCPESPIGKNEEVEELDAARLVSLSVDSAQEGEEGEEEEEEEDELEIDEAKEMKTIPLSSTSQFSFDSENSQEKTRNQEGQTQESKNENDVVIVIDYSSDISTPHELQDAAQRAFFGPGGPTKQPVELVLSSATDEFPAQQQEEEEVEEEQLVEIFVSDYEPVKDESLIVRELGPVLQFATLHTISSQLVPIETDLAQTEQLKPKISNLKRQPEILLELEPSIQHLAGQQRVCICDTGELLNLACGQVEEANLDLYTSKRIEEFEEDIARAEREAEAEAELECELAQEPELEQHQVILHQGCNELRQQYALGDELGRGKFGTVFRCAELASGREFAAKFVALRRQEDRADVLREIEIMSRLQHKRLLQLYDAYDDQMKGEMCLITELIEGGELFERIVDDDFELTERKAAIFMRQICEGVGYMHSLGIVHLDLKPENILCVSKSGCRIKLIDFGLARQLKVDEPLRVMFGTPDFAAPEVLAYELVSIGTDMWSVGVICYVLLSGLSPFMGDSDLETMANVARATYDFDDQAFDPISSEAKNFIQSLLIREPEKRLTASDCLDHPWLAPRDSLALIRKQRQVSENVPDINAQRRRQSMGVVMSSVASESNSYSPDTQEQTNKCERCARPQVTGERSYTLPLMVSLDKGNLKKYVVRRKWHKTVHAILALNRMGANLRLRLVSESHKLEV